MSPAGAISVPFPPKTGTNLLHPRPRPQSLNGSSSGTKGGRKSCEKGTEEVVTGRVRSVSSQSGQALCWLSVTEVPLQALNSALALVLCICAGGSEQLAHDG